MGNYRLENGLRRSRSASRIGLALVAVLLTVLVISLASGIRSMAL